jgi:hypothetical protein
MSEFFIITKPELGSSDFSGLSVGLSGVSKNAGVTDATTLRVITASDGPLNSVMGTTTGAAITTDVAGSIQQYLRGLVNLAAGTLTTNSVMLTSASNLTGQITVTTSGIAVSGPNVTNVGGFWLKGHPDNTDTVWVMASGVAKTSGFPLNKSEQTFVPITNLNLLAFDADVSGEKVCYAKA